MKNNSLITVLFLYLAFSSISCHFVLTFHSLEKREFFGFAAFVLRDRKSNDRTPRYRFACHIGLTINPSLVSWKRGERWRPRTV